MAGINLIPDNIWAKFTKAMDSAHLTYNKDVVVWHRYKFGLDYNGRDHENDTFEDRNLLALMDFNQFHKWPINATELAGELDRMNAFMMLNKNYLQEAGYLTPEGNFNYGDKVRDRFVHDGVIYKAYGDTPLSQGNTGPYHIGIILQRQETMTGDTTDTQAAGIDV